MMEIRVMVVDDEPFSRAELIHLLGEFSGLKVIGEAGSAEEALEMILKQPPDVLFLDIEMTGMNGIELAEMLGNLRKPPAIVFATAYPDYAVKAFRLEAIDYLLKPFDELQLAETIERVKSSLQKTVVPQPAPLGKLAVHQEDRISYVDPQSIVYIYREGRDTFIITENERFSTKLALKEVEQKLTGYPFFRVHKGYLVNTERIEELVAWSTSVFQLKLQHVKESIPVSRNYVKELKERLEL